MVLFSGTPCQVAGLYAIVDRHHEGLLTCDLLCYGVPSPGVFADYVAYVESEFKTRLVDIDFREKEYGWEKPRRVALLANGEEHEIVGGHDAYFAWFSSDITLRPVCYNCRYRTTRRVGDITLGDFWGIGTVVPFAHDTRYGVSLILLNSEKGKQMKKRMVELVYMEERTIDEALMRNRLALAGHQPKPYGRERFFAAYNSYGIKRMAKRYGFEKTAKNLARILIPSKVINFLSRHRA